MVGPRLRRKAAAAPRLNSVLVVSNDPAAYLPEQNGQEVTAVKVVDIGVSLSGFRSPPPSIVEISPPDIARRRLENWGAIQADNVRVTRRETFEYRFQARRHLLIAYERAERDDGETLIEGLPTASSAWCRPDIGSTDGRRRAC